MNQTTWPTEVSENDAVGEVAEIYTDIKAVLGVPMVNLLYRRLAVEPLALRWAWNTIRDVAISGELSPGAATLAQPLSNLRPSHLPAAVLRTVGIDASAQKAVEGVVAAYNDANPRNLIGTSIWAGALIGETPGRSRSAAAPAAAKPTATRTHSMPQMIAIDRMDANTAAIVRALLQWRNPAETPSVPSLYRHLANWPAFLAIAFVQLEPLFAGGLMATTRQAVQREAMITAHDVLVRHPPPHQPLPEGAALGVLKDIAAVYPIRISELVVVGHILAGMLNNDSS